MRRKTVGNKVVSVLLAGALAASLAACGGNTANTGADAGNNAADAGTKEDTKSAETETAADTEESSDAAVADSGYEAKDLGGRTIKIGLWWDEYWDSNYQSLDDIEAAGGSWTNEETMQMKLDAVRAVEEKWNCKIEWVNLGWDGIIDSINTSVTAGTPDCDIYLTDLQFGISPVANGYVQKISDYAPADSDILTDGTVFTRQNLLGNDDYLFHESTTIPSVAMYMTYNAAMIDSLGLEAPESLAEKGEWTWDKFAEYAKACTQDTDGDGNMDVYGYGSAWTLTVQGFCASNNAAIADSSTEGLSDPKTVEAFNFIDQLYNVDKSARPYQDDWNNDLLAFSSGKVAFAFAQPWILIQEIDNHDFDMRICPAPVGPSGDGSMTPAMITNNYMIPVGVEDATSVYCVFEEMMNWYHDDISYRDDPEWFESGFVDEDQVTLANKLGALANNDLWNSIDSEGAVSKVFYGDVVNGDSTVSQAIESNKQILQDEIDTLKIQ